MQFKDMNPRWKAAARQALIHDLYLAFDKSPSWGAIACADEIPDWLYEDLFGHIDFVHDDLFDSSDE